MSALEGQVVMSATLDRIRALSGEMPDWARHCRHLGRLPLTQLEQRLRDLEDSEERHARRRLPTRIREYQPLQSTPP